ncbi:Hypothetical protein CINCED_3A000720 [Cinara cedri]|uniref:Helicase ATP-binding domain-containing protein n=1 Tax=Cinara cedri TaxID=506608 RepID=A0A5E4NNH9_9HEMI|nr:Hypothetical protein CINCED_3A000720 [Cinara cedri]
MSDIYFSDQSIRKINNIKMENDKSDCAIVEELSESMNSFQYPIHFIDQSIQKINNIKIENGESNGVIFEESLESLNNFQCPLYLSDESNPKINNIKMEIDESDCVNVEELLESAESFQYPLYFSDHLAQKINNIKIENGESDGVEEISKSANSFHYPIYLSDQSIRKINNIKMENGKSNGLIVKECSESANSFQYQNVVDDQSIQKINNIKIENGESSRYGVIVEELSESANSLQYPNVIDNKSLQKIYKIKMEIDECNGLIVEEWSESANSFQYPNVFDNQSIQKINNIKLEIDESNGLIVGDGPAKNSFQDPNVLNDQSILSINKIKMEIDKRNGIIVEELVEPANSIQDPNVLNDHSIQKIHKIKMEIDESNGVTDKLEESAHSFQDPKVLSDQSVKILNTIKMEIDKSTCKNKRKHSLLSPNKSSCNNNENQLKRFARDSNKQFDEKNKLWNIDVEKIILPIQDKSYTSSSKTKTLPALSQVLIEDKFNDSEYDICESSRCCSKNIPESFGHKVIEYSPDSTTASKNLFINSNFENNVPFVPSEVVPKNPVLNNKKDPNKLVEKRKPYNDDSDANATPKGLLVGLLPHQIRTILWLMQKETEPTCGGILVDDICLGITLTMVSFILKSLEEQQDSMCDDDKVNNGGTLIICPFFLMEQWHKEVLTNVNSTSVKICKYHQGEKNVLANQLNKYDIVITSFKCVKWDYKNNPNTSPLFNIKWKRIILDEAINIQKYNTQACISICKLSSIYRWAIVTETPIPNEEFYSLLKFIQCKPFDSLPFWKQFIDSSSNAEVPPVILTHLIQSLMQRYTKGELDQFVLPVQTVFNIEVGMSVREKDVYNQILQFSKYNLDAIKSSKQKSKKPKKVQHFLELELEKENVFPELEQFFHSFKNKELRICHMLVLQLRLRQACCHPSLIVEKLPRKVNIGRNAQETKEPIIFENTWPSSKIIAICNMIKTTLFANHGTEKLIIVSQWCSMLNLIHNYLSKNCSLKMELITRIVNIEEKNNIVRNFNSSSGPRVLFTTLKYITECDQTILIADHIFFTEAHWNPQWQSKICYRIRRVGQTKPINIYNFVCSNTLESKILEIHEERRKIAQKLYVTGNYSQENIVHLLSG